MSIVATLETNVARGAELLDEKIPDWFLRVEPMQVEMEDDTEQDGLPCLLHHLYGDYSRGLIELDIECRAPEYGFTSVWVEGVENNTDLQFDTLTALWRDVIARKRTEWLIKQSTREEVRTSA